MYLCDTSLIKLQQKDGENLKFSWGTPPMFPESRPIKWTYLISSYS